jgi:hypothetical protein
MAGGDAIETGAVAWCGMRWEMFVEQTHWQFAAFFRHAHRFAIPKFSSPTPPQAQDSSTLMPLISCVSLPDNGG